MAQPWETKADRERLKPELINNLGQAAIEAKKTRRSVLSGLVAALSELRGETVYIDSAVKTTIKMGVLEEWVPAALAGAGDVQTTPGYYQVGSTDPDGDGYGDGPVTTLETLDDETTFRVLSDTIRLKPAEISQS